MASSLHGVAVPLAVGRAEVRARGADIPFDRLGRVAHLVLLRRRARSAPRLSSLAIVREAIGRGVSIRRHLPPALFLLGTVLALFALSRPTASITLPSQQKTIILAIDVSLSMRASDIQPNRMSAQINARDTQWQSTPVN